MLNTNTVIFLWFLGVGMVGIFRPTFFFKSEKLTPEKIERNTKLWKWCGVGLTVCGIAGLIVEFVRHS
jgi:hypothetical protein